MSSDLIIVPYVVPEPRKWLIIDTDAGVDDAVAIALALRLSARYGYEVKLITTVFGNCNLNKVIKNVAKTRAACGLSAEMGPEIRRGCAEPLVGGPRMDAEYFHGADGLGNTNFAEEPSGVLDGGPCDAVDRMLELIAEGERLDVPVTLITLGPLTNIAALLARDQSVPKRLERLVVIGGCGNARGNVHRTTEFNVTADPEAAAEVFNCLARTNSMCLLVSWELTLAYSIPWTVYNEEMSVENAAKSRLNHFLREICAFSFGKNEKIGLPHFSLPGQHFGGAVICDLLAVAVALNPEGLIKSAQDVNVEVELVGSLTRGQTVVDWGCFDPVARPMNCKWITEIDLSVYLQMFRDIFDK